MWAMVSSPGSAPCLCVPNACTLRYHPHARRCLPVQMYELLEDLWNKGYGRPAQHANMPLSAIRNAEGQTPLVYAAALGHVSLLHL